MTALTCRRFWFGSVPPLAACALVGGLFVRHEQTRPQVRALVVTGDDVDGDGWSSAQERVLGTSPDTNDTDGDGFYDAEEIARQSSPLFAASRPAARRVSLGMTAHGARENVNVVISLYTKGVSISELNVVVGVFASNRLVQLPNSYIAAHSELQLVPCSDPAATNALLVVAVRPEWVHTLGSLTFFATASNPGTGLVVCADTVHLLSIGGMVVLGMPDPLVPPPSESMISNLTTTQGSIYVPLPIGAGGSEIDYPDSWSPDSVCYQRTSAMSVQGAVVTQEVVTSECRDGWDGACPSSCSSSVGSTFTTVDPVILVGG